MKKLLLVLLGLTSAILILIVSLLIWIVFFPGQAWKFADRHLLPADLDIKWSKIDFDIQKENWRLWKIEWSIHELQVLKGSPELEINVDRIALDFDVRVGGPRPWFDFREIEAAGGKPMRVKLAKSEDDGVQSSPYQHVQTYLGYFSNLNRLSKIEKLNAVVPELTIEFPEGPPLSIHAEVVKTGAVDVNVRVRRGDLDVGLKGIIVNEPFGFEGKLNVKAGAVTTEDSLKLTYADDVLKLNGASKLAIKMEKKLMRFEPHYQLTLERNIARLALHTRIRGIPGPVIELKRVDARIEMPVEDDIAWSAKPTKVNIWSKVDLFFIDKDMRPPLEKACKCKIPERLEARIEGGVFLDRLLNDDLKKKLVVDTKVSLESVSNKLFTSDLAANIQIFQENKVWLFEPILDSELVVHSFQGLKNFLDAKNVMVPAPLDVLEGELRLKAKGNVEQAEKRFQTKADIVANLRSANQKVQLETSILFDFDSALKGVDIHVDALIKMLRIELPPLDPILGLPPLTRDRRVSLKPAAKKKRGGGFKTRVFLQVRTESNGAIQLLSKFAKPHVPITLQLNTRSQQVPTGMLRLEPFTISYLRRNVNVEKLQISFSDRDDVGLPIDGRFRIDQTDYRIFISVAGTLESPNVQLSSEPYLPRGEIISVLLYDRTSVDLVSADAETVGSFEAALADRAIGLFGLWAFASTPIRSFSYNAVTKVYSATVQLADGLTAGVGTNWEQAAHLEVRKRVSKRWVLTASWSPSDSNDDQIGKLVLQWEKRF